LKLLYSLNIQILNVKQEWITASVPSLS